MKINALDNFPELKSKFDEIDRKFLGESRERLESERKISEKILDSLNRDHFELRKDFLVLSGTIFGSSIALATGKPVNSLFIFGEFSLFVSIVAGLILLLSHLKEKEWDYSFFSKSSLESFLLLNKKRIDDFELKMITELIASHQRIIDSNQRGTLHFILKKISIENWRSILNISFLVGIFFILISILPTFSNTKYGVSQMQNKHNYGLSCNNQLKLNNAYYLDKQI